MKLWNAKSRRISIYLHDITLCVCAWFLSFSLRHNFEGIPLVERNAAILISPYIVLAQTFFFYKAKTYRALWRYLSVNDLFQLLVATLLTTLSLSAIVYWATHFQDFPRSILPLYLINSMALLCFPRLINRLYRDKHVSHSEVEKALIVGAGSAGERLLRDFIRRGEGKIKIEGFVDDDQYKKGQKIHNVSVLASTAKLPRLIEKYSISKIFIAIPSATSQEMRRIVSLCKKDGVQVNTLPSLNDVVSGRITIDSLKGISIEDLLGRVEHDLKHPDIFEQINNRVILVTGAGGSIGSELSRQIMNMSPSKLLLIDHSEYNLYKIQQEFESSCSDVCVPLLGSITDKVFLEDVFEKYQIDKVFHAAAYKHVPMLEGQVRSAVVNNVLGTYHLATLSNVHHVNNFIMISTDKAVKPTNLMGATKRLAEMICQTMNGKSSTKYSIVRFGNVLGSQGSVLPLFKKQLQQGGPLTVTDPEITRYFMSIPEAANLILQSTIIEGDGDIYVLDMGEPIKILYLAEQIISLSGKTPYKDINIEFTGLRPGEKMYEELFYEQEQLIPTRIGKIMVSKAITEIIDLNAVMSKLNSASKLSDEFMMKKIIKERVATYAEPELTNHSVEELELEHE